MHTSDGWFVAAATVFGLSFLLQVILGVQVHDQAGHLFLVVGLIVKNREDRKEENKG